MFTHDEVLKFEKDAHKYEAKINKGICLNVYNEMVEARTYIRTQKTLKSFLPKMHEQSMRSRERITQIQQE
jgi:nucleolar protein 58